MDIGTFHDLKKKSSSKFLDRIRQIKERFCIDFKKIERKDLYRPLVSALAARLHLSRFNKTTTEDITEQAEYWKAYFNSHSPNAKGTPEKFLEDLKTLPKTETVDEGSKNLESVSRGR